MLPNIRYAFSHPENDITDAARAGIVNPPKLFPEVTAPMTLPLVLGNHNGTILPEVICVAPGNPA
jgi:hypothetical protein